MKNVVIALSSPVVVLMRGLPGSGKSTWLREHHCEDYVISPDTFRLILSPPIQRIHGALEINQEMSGDAWRLSYEALRSRLAWRKGNARGATFFDATFMNERTIHEIMRIILEEGHGRVKVFIVDFTILPVAEVKRRNNLRKGTLRYVPDEVINRMWENGRHMDLSKFDVEIVHPDEVEIVP